jgi:hypothetical protein
MGNALRGLNTDTSNMKPIEDAGAVGVVHVWNGVSDGNAQDQAVPPFGTPTRVPVVLVGHNAGQRLKSLAASGTTATLTHHAVIHPDVSSDNIWSVLPGQSDETIIINTHTDGCNANEENGFFGVVALARYFATRPLSDRRRTLVFLMTSGHFGHGYFRGTADWIQTHDDVMKKAVACVTIEHLGALGWMDDPGGTSTDPRAKGNGHLPTPPCVRKPMCSSLPRTARTRRTCMPRSLTATPVKGRHSTAPAFHAFHTSPPRNICSSLLRKEARSTR